MTNIYHLVQDFLKPTRSLWLELIVSFVIGLAFAPFSRGFFIFILSLFFYEIIVYLLCRKVGWWDIEERGAIICISVLGFFAGRKLLGLDPFDVGSVPFTNWPASRHIKT
jgi:hypothetical protein